MEEERFQEKLREKWRIEKQEYRAKKKLEQTQEEKNAAK
jgi:hypothetical protein